MRRLVHLILAVPFLVGACIQQPAEIPASNSTVAPTLRPTPEPTLPSIQNSRLALTPTPIAVSSSPLPVQGFAVGGLPFQFLGAILRASWTGGSGWSKTANDLIKSAKDNGITVLQIELPYFESPQLGDFHENILVKLDYLLDSAYRNGVYVIIPFIHAYGISLFPNDPYYNSGGIEGLVKDQKLREAFKKRMAKIISRVNTVNGRKYSEDPTILAWMIAQEIVSRAVFYKDGTPKVTTAELRDWIEDMVSQIRSLDRNHLVTFNTHKGISKLGKDWLTVFSVPDLDFVEVEDAEGSLVNLTPDGDAGFYIKVFTLNRPVVMMISFTGGSVDQAAVSKDYVWQAEELREIFKVYYEMGVAVGFTIFSWGTDPEVPDKDYLYTSSNKPIAQAFLDIASTLGSRNSTTIPLELVRLSR